MTIRPTHDGKLLLGQHKHCEIIVPSDTEDLPRPMTVFLGYPGAIHCTTAGREDISLSVWPAGIPLPFAVRRVWKAGTSAPANSIIGTF